MGLVTERLQNSDLNRPAKESMNLRSSNPEIRRFYHIEANRIMRYHNLHRHLHRICFRIDVMSPGICSPERLFLENGTAKLLGDVISGQDGFDWFSLDLKERQKID